MIHTYTNSNKSFRTSYASLTTKLLRPICTGGSHSKCFDMSRAPTQYSLNQTHGARSQLFIGAGTGFLPTCWTGRTPLQCACTHSLRTSIRHRSA